MHNDEMAGGVEYSGYVILPTPQRLDDGRWNMSLQIERHDSGGLTTRLYHASNLWESEEEAVEHCVRMGRQIIDGELPDLTPP